MAKRKRRSDRNHVVYRIENKLNGEFYIGITVAQGGAFLRSAKKRFKAHVSRATHQDHDWTMCNAIREYGAKAFSVSVVEIVRGKAEAHKRETELIKMLNPQLNTASC